MPLKQSIQLGQVQETLLVPLYCRALESRRKRPVLDDPKAIEMVESIDWDFQRWNIGLRLVESRSILDVPDALKPRLSVTMRTTFRVVRRLFPQFAQGYQLNLFAVQPAKPAS
jgi:O-methyltransferase involved in polyketide biosynthesis